jgi:hypothetical protein
MDGISWHPFYVGNHVGGMEDCQDNEHKDYETQTQITRKVNPIRNITSG